MHADQRARRAALWRRATQRPLAQKRAHVVAIRGARCSGGVRGCGRGGGRGAGGVARRGLGGHVLLGALGIRGLAGRHRRRRAGCFADGGLAEHRERTEELALAARDRRRAELRERRELQTWEDLERERVGEIRRLKTQLKAQKLKTKRERKIAARQAKLNADFEAITGRAPSTGRCGADFRTEPEQGTSPPVDPQNPQLQRAKEPCFIEVEPADADIDLHGLARRVVSDSATRAAVVGKGEAALFAAVAWDDYWVDEDASDPRSRATLCLVLRAPRVPGPPPPRCAGRAPSRAPSARRRGPSRCPAPTPACHRRGRRPP